MANPHTATRDDVMNAYEDGFSAGKMGDDRGVMDAWNALRMYAKHAQDAEVRQGARIAADRVEACFL